MGTPWLVGWSWCCPATFRIAVPDAKLGFPEVRWGIFPSGGGALKLERQIGFTWARDLLLTGRLISAAEAQAVGLVGQVVAPGEVLTAALQRAESIVTNSPVAVTAVKRFLANRAARDFAADTADEDREAKAVRASRDRLEGIEAFLNRRAPLYQDPAEDDAGG